MFNLTKQASLLCGLALLLLTSGCSSPGAAHATLPPPPVDVEVVQVVQKDIPIYGEWVGELAGRVNATIKAQVSGYLLKQDYKEGEFVKQGHLLFELDPRPLEAALSQAEGQLAQAHGQLGQASSQQMQAQAGLLQAHSQELQALAVLSQSGSQLLQARAALAQAQANQVKTQLDVDKYRPLYEEKAVTQQDLDNAVQSNQATRAQVDAARAQIANAQAVIGAARAQVGNARGAVAAAQAQIGTAQATITTAQAQIQTSEAAVRTAQLNLRFTQIVSPIDGIAGLAKAQVGDLIGPTTDALTTVSKVDPIKANFTIPEQEYVEYTRQYPTSASRWASHRAMSFQLIFADGTVYPHAGRFFAEDRDVADSTGAMRLAAVFPNPGGTLRPGQYARIRAAKYIRRHALLVPQRCVSELLDHNQVAVVGAGNKISIRTVRLGERVGSDWIVEDGVHPDDRVVAEGVSKVGPDMVVNPKPFAAGKK